MALEDFNIVGNHIDELNFPADVVATDRLKLHPDRRDFAYMVRRGKKDGLVTEHGEAPEAWQSAQ